MAACLAFFPTPYCSPPSSGLPFPVAPVAAMAAVAAVAAVADVDVLGYGTCPKCRLASWAEIYAEF
jgi:hypothetical protein